MKKKDLVRGSYDTNFDTLQKHFSSKTDSESVGITVIIEFQNPSQISIAHSFISTMEKLLLVLI